MKFEVIEKTNDWTKEVKKSESANETQQQRYDYWVAFQDYRYLILESGEPLVAAMALYRQIGYKVIPNYGQYKDMPDSICMKKEL